MNTQRLIIVILSQSSRLYSTRRLKEAAIARGHKVKILDTLQFSIHVEQRNPELFYKNKLLSNVDIVIPRIRSGISTFGTAVVRQFEQKGIYCLNSSQSITNSRDKLCAIQMLSRHDVGIPLTTFVRNRSAVLNGIVAMGGAPVIIKLLEGTQGVGVILAESEKAAETIVETLHSAKQNVLIQKFVKESCGKDIRAIVVGGKVVAAMRRIASGDEFRSNVHRGAKVEAVSLDPLYEKAAIQAAQILGLNFAGVDILESVDGPKVMEVNASPGLRGIEMATGIPVAESLIEYVEEQFDFPEIDLRQRLTLDKGYGVAEIPITFDSELTNKTIDETELKDRDILVLSIIRGAATIPNPKSISPLFRGDILLCYGKLSTLKRYVKKYKTKVRLAKL